MVSEWKSGPTGGQSCVHHNTVFLHAKHVIQSRARDLIMVMPEFCGHARVMRARARVFGIRERSHARVPACGSVFHPQKHGPARTLKF